jgi:hypothetical protein
MQLEESLIRATPAKPKNKNSTTPEMRKLLSLEKEGESAGQVKRITIMDKHNTLSHQPFNL